MVVAADYSQKNAVMRVYSCYRLVLANLLFFSFFITEQDNLIGSERPGLFVLVSFAYLGYSLLALCKHLLSRREPSDNILFFDFFIDVGAIMLMAYCSGSGESGLPLLLIVSISAASMTLPARLCLSIASLSTITTLADAGAHSLNAGTDTRQFVVAGMTGIAYFSTALIIRYLSGRITSAQNLAERRRYDLETLSEINQSIVQRMQTGIVLMSRSGRIKLLNAAAAELLNIRYQHAPRQLFAPPQLIELAMRGRSASEVIQLNSTGLELHINLTHLDHNSEDECLLYIENISKINQRAQNLKLASLGRFSASIAHEIRNPLAAISHAAQLLKENENLDVDDRRFLDIIHNNSVRMDGIIKNILNMSRGNPPRPQRFSLVEHLDQFCQEWHCEQRDKTTLTVSGREFSGQVNVDPHQLNQILSNLTENGVRHAIAAHGSAEIQFVISAGSATGGPCVDIIDSGPGINEADHDRIFEPFFTTQTQGNGLGLYLCRELCLANQIAISYQRGTSKESRFRLQFAHPERGTFAE